MKLALTPTASFASVLLGLMGVSISLTSCQRPSPQTRTPPSSSASPTASPTAAVPASRQAQAYVGAMNRSQEALFLEKGEFAASLAELQLNIQPNGYTYRVHRQPGKPQSVINVATTTQPGQPNFLGFVYVVTDANKESVTVSQVCQTSLQITDDVKLSPPSTTDPVPCPPDMPAVP